MPLINPENSYQAPFWLPEGHSQSIFPSLFRKVQYLSAQRERLILSDGDFVDLDWYVDGPLSEKPLLIISHGLEGSSQAQYVLGLTKTMREKGFHVLAWNFRSCSGELNTQLRSYHSGATDDLEEVIQACVKQGAKELYLAGFSLGGNLTLKWLGEKGQNHPNLIRKAVAFSVPLHLSSSSRKLARLENGLYTHRFLQTLLAKAQAKAAKFPGAVDPAILRKIKTLKEFDDVITGPWHGFKDAEDYYEQNSSLYFLSKIQVPTLVVNAQNDPFLSPECLPADMASKWEHVFLELPEQGGHCGFYPVNYQGTLWSEQQAMNWFLNKETINYV
ncbi:YheT family hydrolase [Aquirufa rosea]|uniref:Alpha/beta fold hydrolase n=1 Tax=Aquirufa rosea TaxID=2509241 RepID=A0A4Q1C0Z9_9BACT|nr:alpha/beta fold hydrolase [Aquirufa rosea]RXK50815.1 alpha/beta fold hydrolase [Aquirufa rosea]